MLQFIMAACSTIITLTLAFLCYGSSRNPRAGVRMNALTACIPYLCGLSWLILLGLYVGGAL